MIELEALTSLIGKPKASKLNNKNLLRYSIKLLKIQIVNVSILEISILEYSLYSFHFCIFLSFGKNFIIIFITVAILNITRSIFENNFIIRTWATFF